MKLLYSEVSFQWHMTLLGSYILTFQHTRVQEVLNTSIFFFQSSKLPIEILNSMLFTHTNRPVCMRHNGILQLSVFSDSLS